MLRILSLLTILIPASAFAVPYRVVGCEARLLGRELATAAAEPENLVDVMIAMWPRSRAIFDRLGATYRRGWQRIGIPDAMGETVLAHTFNVVRAVREYARCAPELDVRRAMWMAMIHDFPEYLVPDYTPYDPISREEKFQREHHAMREIVDWLGDDARVFEDLWLAFERGHDREAELVRQIDALDILPSACAYERFGFEVSEFLTRLEPRVTDPHLRRVFEDLVDARADDFVDFRGRYFERVAGPRW